MDADCRSRPSCRRPVAVGGCRAARRPRRGRFLLHFEQYKEYRIKSLDQARERLAQRLADPALPADLKKRLQQRKAYYDWLAQMPVAERDRRFRERFDAIDTDHDGKIDPAERAAWREKQRAYYRKLRDERPAGPARNP